MAASLTVSRAVTEIHNLLVCDACEKTIKEPKILPCLHSFCKACLENLPVGTDSEGKKFSCPTCMSTVALKPNENVAGLPDNEFIVKLLTAVGPDRKQQTCVCSYPLCKKEPSITICMECEMLFCHECYTAHENFPTLKNHTILSISEIINSDEQQEIGVETLSCTQHKDAIPKFCCETCRELICIKCVACVHTKPGHTCVAIHEAFRKQQEAVKSRYDTINAMKLEGTKALDTVNKSKATYEKTAKDIKVKHTAQKDEMMKTLTDTISKVLEKKITEVDQVYDPACQKLSVQAEAITNYLKKVEKSLHRTSEVLKNSKLQELVTAEKMIDDDIQMLQNEKPLNLTSFQVRIENPGSCVEKLCFYATFMDLAAKSFISDTVILKDDEKLIRYLFAFLNNKNAPLKLCYRASLHGWSSQHFHEKCDGKADTVVLVKVGNCIFGGYTDQTLTWDRNYKGSNVSFLFSLRNPNDMQPFKCPIINGKNAYAINCYSLYGATFGGGHDLHIANNANANRSSYSNLGNTYQPPAEYQYGTQQTQSLFAGSFSFTPTEIEVFY